MILSLLFQIVVNLLRSWLMGVLLSLLLPGFLQLFKPPMVLATAPPPKDELQLIFADDFEFALEKWEQARGGSDRWQITRDNKLEAYLPGRNMLSEIVPTDFYWDDGWKHYRIEFEFTVFTTADVNWVWGFEDSSNWYELHIYGAIAQLVRLKNNRVVFRRSFYIPFEMNTPHQIVIVFNQGRIMIWINEELLINQQDTSYEGNTGKPSLKATTGAAFPTRVQYDKVRVYLIKESEGEEEEELNRFFSLVEFKQYQQPWRDDEYNHALSWRRWGNWRQHHPEQPPDQVTIYHWGCAMTSLAMVMQYHGLDTMPTSEVSGVSTVTETTGEQLNPRSLNNWLAREADGYVGEGALNWLAGTRLARLISEEFSTAEQVLPKLEYRRYHSQLEDYLLGALGAQRPAILQIPGHFLVAQGYYQPDSENDPESYDWYISDPAYTHTMFSQHQQSLLSVADLVPSHTDLSYLLLVYEPSVLVQILNEAGEITLETVITQDTVANQFYEVDGCQEQAQDPEHPYQCVHHHSAPITQWLAKPETGEYQLEMLAQDPGVHQLQFYFYDEQAEVKMLDWFFVQVEDESKHVVVSYHKQELGAVQVQGEVVPDFWKFTDNLAFLYAKGDLPTRLYLALAEIVVWSEESELTDEALGRYQQLALSYIYQFQGQLEVEVLQHLVSGLT